MRKYLSSALFVAAIFFSTVLTAQNSGNLFFVFLNSNPDKAELSKQEVENLQAKHLENISRLADQGIMKAAGPFDGGGGLFILDAENIESAAEILSTDPAIAAERYKLEIFPLTIAINDLCGAKEPYKMVTYQFVRLTSDPEYFGDMDQMARATRFFNSDLYHNNDFIVVQGNFGEYNEGFIILDVATADEAQSIMNQHPAVKAGQLKPEVKSLWIAEGTFCKK